MRRISAASELVLQSEQFNSLQSLETTSNVNRKTKLSSLQSVSLIMNFCLIRIRFVFLFLFNLKSRIILSIVKLWLELIRRSHNFYRFYACPYLWLLMHQFVYFCFIPFSFILVSRRKTISVRFRFSKLKSVKLRVIYHCRWCLRIFDCQSRQKKFRSLIKRQMNICTCIPYHILQTFMCACNNQCMNRILLRATERKYDENANKQWHSGMVWCVSLGRNLPFVENITIFLISNHSISVFPFSSLQIIIIIIMCNGQFHWLHSL